ncbi:SDR family oxidoreductase [Zunongwangia endophytica]|uniref:SDR family oxidoreductase n=1 Tax=Zunongwangia endophytica TaxID=1808945 RepID=A0ABV8H8U5_9FLAO|nr:SDR family oxidoreductase [Zunongwangia endophytica]MDN3594812.1 SDR family oxidoreductase [Zunongwangia endophytica]
MDLRLENKIVLVTGGAGIEGSIGQTIVFALAKEGAIPIILDRNERGFDYEKQLQEINAKARFFKTDLSKPEQIKSSIEKIGNEFSGIDIIINNVGVNDGVSLNSTTEDFINSLHLNLISYFATLKYALPLLKTKKGNILNIGSKVAITGQGGTSGYAASKGGVLGLTREWAVDLIQYNIRCNALIIAESMTPAYQDWLDTLKDGEAKRKAIEEKIPFENRMTSPDEIANMALFIISERSTHTTGQFIFVDGGYVHLDRALLNNS